MQKPSAEDKAKREAAAKAEAAKRAFARAALIFALRRNKGLWH